MEIWYNIIYKQYRRKTMRKAKGRNQLVKKLQEINEHIIIDLIVDNFNEHLLNSAFKVDTTLSLNYSDRIIYITKNILAGNEKYLNTVINYNNTYITENGYDKLTEEEYREKCLNNEIRSLTGSGINTEQMILYIMTTVEFIEANRIFRNSEKIKNKDIVIFDTSYNSHSAFYKVKSITDNLLYINKSNIQEKNKRL